MFQAKALLIKMAVINHNCLKYPSYTQNPRACLNIFQIIKFQTRTTRLTDKFARLIFLIHILLIMSIIIIFVKLFPIG